MIIKRMSRKTWNRVQKQRRYTMTPELREQGYYCTDNREYYRIEYLRSPEWKKIRDVCLKSYPQCSLCGGKAVDCHHVNYRGLWDVKLKDVRSLCRDCHDYIHNLIQNDKLVFIKSREVPHGLKWKKTIYTFMFWKLVDMGFSYPKARKKADEVLEKFTSDRTTLRESGSSDPIFPLKYLEDMADEKETNRELGEVRERQEENMEEGSVSLLSEAMYQHP